MPFHTKAKRRKLKRQFKSFQNAPKIGERRIKKVIRSKRFKKIRKKGIRLRNNIDDFFQDQTSSIRNMSPKDIGF